MNNKDNKVYLSLFCCLLPLTLILFTFLGYRQSSASHIDALLVNNEYQGLQSPLTVAGTFKGLIAISEPVQLGVVDLGLTLEQQSNILTGQINITNTLVYSSTPAVTGILIDNGVLTPSFQLTSEPFTIIVAGREVQRTFQLSGDVLDNGVTLQGTYTETLTGLTPEPLVVVGNFILTRPVPLGSSSTATTIFLPLIRR